MTSEPDTEQELGSDGEVSDSSELLLSTSSQSSTEMEQKNASERDTSTSLEPPNHVAVRSEDEEDEMEFSNLIDAERQIYGDDGQHDVSVLETERVIPNLEKPQKNAKNCRYLRLL